MQRLRWPNRGKLAWWLLVLLAGLGACGPPEADTAVVVTLEVDERLGERASSLAVAAWGGENWSTPLNVTVLPEHVALIQQGENGAVPPELQVSVLASSSPSPLVQHVFRNEFVSGRIPWVRMRLWDDGCTPDAQQACTRLGGRICCQGRCQKPPELSAFPEWVGERPTPPFPEEALWCPPIERGDDPIVDIDAGFGAYCAVTERGGVLCWGLISWPGDSVGVGGGHVRRVPLPDGVKAERVAVGWGFACALSSDPTGAQRVFCWGRNQAGQVGAPASATMAPAMGEPDLSPVDGRIAEIDAGLSFACIRSEGGAVWCWGDAARGQIGFVPPGGLLPLNDDAVAPTPSPRRVDLTDVSAVALALGGAHACILGVEDGSSTHRSVWCWGDNELGQTGMGVGSPSSPGHADARRLASVGGNGGTMPLDAPRLLAAGFATSCVLQEANLVCWGYWPAMPPRLIEPAPRFVALAGGGGSFPDLATAERLTVGGGILEGGSQALVHLCVQDAKGVTGCLGSPARGQIGPESTGSTFATQWNTVFWGRVMDVAAGALSSCALRSWGEVLCWGDEQGGQLGRGTLGPDPRPIPAPIVRPDASR